MAGRPKGSRNKPRTPEKEIATGKVERIPLELIDIDDTTFRFRVKMRLGNLPESIEANGQQFPVLLRRRPGTNRFQIISGFRRITSLLKLRWTHVNAIIREDLDDDLEAFRISVIENEIRQTYNDLDRAYAILAYREMGKSNAEIEELFTIGARQRQRLQKLVDFPEALKDAVADGTVSSTNAVRLMQHVDKYPDTDVGAWIKRIDEEQMSYNDLNKALKAAAAEATGENQSIEFFVRKKKGDKRTIRVRPISISDELSAAQRQQLLKDLDKIKRFIKELDK